MQAEVPVAMAPGLPADQSIWGRLCVPAGHRTRAVQLLVHGLSYSHYYWDPVGLPASYSYVRAAGAAGMATFNIDRIGVGNSSHPASGSITLESNAFTIHQVVTALHRQVAGHRFEQVSLVGHSYGSEIAGYEAGTFRDVTSLVLSGSGHNQSPTASARTTELAEPVAEDPRLAAETPAGDPGYLTLQDAFRPELMYNAADAAPAVVQADIDHKQTLAYTEVATLADGLLPTATASVAIPVLIIDGSKDSLICAADATNCSTAASLAAAEQPFYPETRVAAVVVPDAGHAIDLHRNAPAAFASILGWLRRVSHCNR